MLDNFIRVAISPRSDSQHSLLNRQALEKLTTEYQSKLLAYRLDNLARVPSTPANDVVGLTLPLLEVARNVGRCVADKELRSELNDLLKNQDEEARAQRLVECPSVVLEVLLVLCHERNRQSVTVEEITELVNALLAGRGETNTLSFRGVGAQLQVVTNVHSPVQRGQEPGYLFRCEQPKKNTPASSGLRSPHSFNTGRHAVFAMPAGRPS